MTQLLALFILMINCMTTMNGAEAPVPTPRPPMCYQCASNKSWDDCDMHRKVVSCSDEEQESCATIVLTGKLGDETIKVYGRICQDVPECEDCDAGFLDPSITLTNCDVNCCDGDLCNGAKPQKRSCAKVPMVSVIVLLACVFQAFFVKTVIKEVSLPCP